MRTIVVLALLVAVAVATPKRSKRDIFWLVRMVVIHDFTHKLVSFKSLA